MKKIISLFQRNYDGNRLVRDEIVPGAEWVINGEGITTRKYDGTCCLIKDGKLYKRYEIRWIKCTASNANNSGPQYMPKGLIPNGFIEADEIDETTGKQQGWLPINSGPEDKWHREAWQALCENCLDTQNGTYELLGPKIQGNPEKYKEYVLLYHYNAQLLDCPRDFEGIKEYLSKTSIEGVVWHHSFGRTDGED